MATIQEFDFSVNLMRALLWQYNTAEKLQLLLQQDQDWYNENQTAFWTDWMRDVFNLQTANQFGLTVWSIILNVPIIVAVNPIPGKVGFGWGPLHKNFTHGNFNTNQPTAQQLTVEQARLVLRLRYYQLTTGASVPQINRIMKEVFGPGQVYVLDGNDMTMTYVFTFQPSSQLQYIFQNYDILPRPAGVLLKFSVQTRVYFGFGAIHKNFDRGNFGA